MPKFYFNTLFLLLGIIALTQSQAPNSSDGSRTNQQAEVGN